MLQSARRSRKSFRLHTFKSSFGGLLMPIHIDIQYIEAGTTFKLPILQPFFYNPTAITHRRLSVDGIMYDVYAAHPESGVTKGNSVVLVIKRRGFEAWGARPTHLWEEDRLDAVAVIEAFFKTLAAAIYVTPVLCGYSSMITRIVIVV
ncbi:hypothetical protein FIBSPDRAFT_949157 [Athelia psychrophila]|uniref:Uncharacterized protein n=1 Tax=Athelia psychrophila TaxID=1759441 RepID=A0A165X2P7_9AGAM|nr:hypothetical protein FIBSPDRAFT_965058 [Fibularhizoctonia sp. CBS 109695]KZP26573.1 hypothetical protein FIBSPDRAFT_949157 [Fibularhizoctonia sp. CBS 109695]